MLSSRVESSSTKKEKSQSKRKYEESFLSFVFIETNMLTILSCQRSDIRISASFDHPHKCEWDYIVILNSMDDVELYKYQLGHWVIKYEFRCLENITVRFCQYQRCVIHT